ncbi:hypothetical protein GCM10017557_69860 [Streptomyces aurantiacus]|uniref:Uncharacterized protein n=1 Tax=Streptomyces aurantiacus TaxID=47760 RepID=A0A7G1PEE4_9ACTN|nr:hypothetical protein GCM10017557_69860 [Streptomyces aurantiacus]
MGGADGYAEAGREAGKGVVAAQVHECDERTPVRRELAPPVTLAVTMSIVTHSTKA